MEKVCVKVVEQYPMTSRDWKNQRGETKVIKTVELLLTDGIDSFYAEASDDLAESLEREPLNKQSCYAVQCRIGVSEWETQSGQKAHATRVRLLRIIPF